MPAFSENYSFEDWLREGQNTNNVRWAAKPKYKELPRVIQHLIKPQEYEWYGGSSIEEIEEMFCYPDFDGDA